MVCLLGFFSIVFPYIETVREAVYLIAKVIIAKVVGLVKEVVPYVIEQYLVTTSVVEESVSYVYVVVLLPYVVREAILHHVDVMEEIVMEDVVVAIIVVEVVIAFLDVGNGSVLLDLDFYLYLDLDDDFQDFHGIYGDF